MKEKYTRLIQLGGQAIVLLWLIAISFSGFASVPRQDISKMKISLKLNAKTLEKAVQQISLESGVTFSYNHNELRKITTPSMEFVNEPVDQVLKKVLAGTSFSFRENENAVVIFKAPASGNAENQQSQKAEKINISGTVSDRTGPLPGVTIKVKNTDQSTSTNEGGKFSISTEPGNILVFSMVGFKTLEVTMGNQTTINVTLEESANDLEEVVIVGYGEQKKANLTGSVATVNAKQLTNRPVTSVQNALQGLIPGLAVLNRPGDIGSDVGSLIVRGRTNLSQPSPMIVIDGIPVSSREFASLSTNDIESMSVLKDAASASIYGSRAANGVILVTTKKGAEGKMTIDLTANYGIQSPTRRPEYLGSADYAMLFNEAMANAGKQPRFTADEITKFQTGSDPDLYPNTDWYDRALVSNPAIKDLQLNFSGSTKATSYYLGLGGLNQESFVQDKDQNRYNLRLNTESQVLPILKVGSNISFIKQDFDTQGGEMNWVALNRLVPTMVATQSDGSWGTINAGNVDATLAKDNILRNMAEAGKRWSRDNIFQAGLNATLNPFKGLTVKGLASLKYDNRQNWIFNNEMPALVNFSTKAEISSTAVLLNEMQERWSRRQSVIVQGYAEYEKTILKHNAKIMAGASQESDVFRNLFIGRKRFPTNELGTVGAGSSDPVDISDGANSSGNVEWAIRSYFGRLNYSFSEKYLIEGNLRMDLSSRFHPDHREALFPSVSAAWRVSEESFMKDINWLNNLKVRGSWGVLGNQDNVSPGNYFSLLNTGYSYNFNGTPVDGIWQSQGTNIFATWEKVYMKNVGLDFSLLRGKLDVAADYYVKTTKDILLNQRALATYGIGMPTKNTGSTENKGVELILNHNNAIGKDFRYNVSVNMSKVKNTILSLGDDDDRISGYWIEKVGGAVGDFYGYEALGLYTSNEEVANSPFHSGSTKAGDIRYKDQNGDGLITLAEDRVVLGNDVPSFTYGASVGASYKGFDVSALAYGVSDVKVYRDAEASFSFFNGAGVKPLHLNRWTPENPDRNAQYPRVLISADGTQNYNSVSSFWLFNGSYIRVRSLSLGYTIPGKVAQKAGMQSARMYISSNNPFTFMNDDRLTDYDPEMSSGRGGYLGAKTWSLGLNVKF